MIGRVALVGAGPGDPGLLTVRGRDLLRSADVVIYDALISDSLLDIAPATTRRVYVGKRAGCHAKPQQEINKLLVDEARAGHFVVRLKGGDPFLFGRGGEEALYVTENGVPLEVVPGVSAVTAVPAAAGIPVTDRGLSSCLIVVTGHEDPSKCDAGVDWPRVAAVPGTLVLFMGMRNLRRIVDQLLENGRSATTPVAVICDGTLPVQQTIVGTLGDISERVDKTGLKAPALVVIGEVVALRERLNWFEGLHLFGRTVVVTRPRRQAEEMCALLVELGARVLTLPMIRVVPPADSAPLQAALKELDQYDWVVFTSTNGVASFFDALAEGGGDVRCLSSCRIAAIGSATAESLRGRGFVPDLVPDRFDSVGLVEGFCKDGSIAGRRVLHPCSSIAPGDLADHLRSAGATVKRVEAYSVVPDGGSLVKWDTPPDVITFASPSAATNFVDLIDAEELDRLKAESVFAAIGPATKARMIELGLPVRILAAEHTGPGFVAAIVQYYLGQRAEEAKRGKVEEDGG